MENEATSVLIRARLGRGVPEVYRITLAHNITRHYAPVVSSQVYDGIQLPAPSQLHNYNDLITTSP